MRGHESGLHAFIRIGKLHGFLVLLKLRSQLGDALGGGVGFVVEHPPGLGGGFFDEAV